MSEKPFCCFIPDQTKLDQGCQNPAAYQIYMLDNPTPDSNTVSCAEHLEVMLDDSNRFEIVRIAAKELERDGISFVLIDAERYTDETLQRVTQLLKEGAARLRQESNPSTCENCGGKDWHHSTECYLGKEVKQ